MDTECITSDSIMINALKNVPADQLVDLDQVMRGIFDVMIAAAALSTDKTRFVLNDSNSRMEVKKLARAEWNGRRINCFLRDN